MISMKASFVLIKRFHLFLSSDKTTSKLSAANTEMYVLSAVKSVICDQIGLCKNILPFQTSINLSMDITLLFLFFSSSFNTFKEAKLLCGLAWVYPKINHLK